MLRNNVKEWGMFTGLTSVKNTKELKSNYYYKILIMQKIIVLMQTMIRSAF